MSISLKADPSGTFGEILVNGAVVAKLPVSGNAVIPGLVGTVSQSGGVPTGAIIERGSNANGQYVRYADGTQICWRGVSLTSPPRGADGIIAGLYYTDIPWTFPVAFSESPSLSGVGVDTNTRGWVSALSADNTGATIAYLSSSSAPSSVIYNVAAIGRWF